MEIWLRAKIKMGSSGKNSVRCGGHQIKSKCCEDKERGCKPKKDAPQEEEVQ